MRKILLVDDDGLFRSSLGPWLRLAGYEVQEACNGNEAILLLSKLSMDLVLTDILMPCLDGLQTIRAVRTRWPALKIIAFSGGGFFLASLYADLSLKLGATRAMEKPFPPEDLLKAIEAAFEGEEISQQANRAEENGAAAYDSTVSSQSLHPARVRFGLPNLPI